MMGKYIVSLSKGIQILLLIKRVDSLPKKYCKKRNNNVYIKVQININSRLRKHLLKKNDINKTILQFLVPFLRRKLGLRYTPVSRNTESSVLRQSIRKCPHLREGRPLPEPVSSGQVQKYQLPVLPADGSQRKFESPRPASRHKSIQDKPTSQDVGFLLQ